MSFRRQWKCKSCDDIFQIFSDVICSYQILKDFQVCYKYLYFCWRQRLHLEEITLETVLRVWHTVMRIFDMMKLLCCTGHKLQTQTENLNTHWEVFSTVKYFQPVVSFVAFIFVIACGCFNVVKNYFYFHINNEITAQWHEL